MSLKNKLISYYLIKTDSFSYLFLSLFFLNFTFVPESVLLFVLKKPLIGIIRPISTIISFILFAFFITIYMKKTCPFKREGKTDYKRILSTLISNLILLAFIFLTYSQLLVIMLKFSHYLLSPNKVIALSVFAVYILIGLIVNIFIFCTIMLFTVSYDYPLNLLQLGRAFLVIISNIFKKFLDYILNSTLILLSFLLIAFSYQYILRLTIYLIPYSFLNTFVSIAIASLLCSFAVYSAIQMSREVLSNIGYKIADRLSKPYKLKLPVFSISIAALSVVLLLSINSLRLSFADGYLDQVKGGLNLGNYYMDIGLSIKAIDEYDNAYSKLIALKGYLEGIKAINEKKTDSYNNALKLIKTSNELYPKNVFSPYFSGNLIYLSDPKNYKNAQAEYINASSYSSVVPEVYFGLLKTYKDEDNKEKVNQTLNFLIQAGVYYDRISSIEGWSNSKIDKYLEKIKDIDNELGPKMAYKAYEKTKLNMHSDAINELLALKKQYPKNSDIDFLIANTYNEYKLEQGNYKNVNNFTQSFIENLDASDSDILEINKMFFKAKMELDINDPVSANRTMEELYNKNKDDLNIKTFYSYTLLKNKKYEDALKISNEVLKNSSEHYLSRFVSAMSNLNLKKYKDSILDIQALVKALEKDNKKAEQDRYLYAFSLAYSLSTRDKAAIDEIENIKSDELLYNYLYGVKGWRDHDNKRALSFMLKVIDINKDLGYAYYIVGVNYFEDEVKTKATDFSNSEKYYLKSIELLPNHVEGYFALGHCYNDWGKYLEALRAFRKVVELLPYEDHRTDPYGMTVHAIGKIYDLQKYDIKEGN